MQGQTINRFNMSNGFEYTFHTRLRVKYRSINTEHVKLLIINRELPEFTPKY